VEGRRLWRGVWQCGLRIYLYINNTSQEKAISLHEAEKEDLEEEEAAEVKPFAASRGWFCHLKNVTILGMEDNVISEENVLTIKGL
jgi:hypothetical protein